MNLPEKLPLFIIRHLIRIKIDQSKGTASDPQVVRPNFKKYLKLFFLNRFPTLFQAKLWLTRRRYPNAVSPDNLLKNHQILTRKYHTIAFDVFDTLIYRAIPGESVKDLTSKYIAKAMNTDYLRIRHLRYLSEIEIGQHNLSQGLDPDNRYSQIVKLWLTKIKNEFPKSKPPSPKQITEYEINIETSCQFTKDYLKTILASLKKQKKKIIFISDFYFDSKVVFAFLKKLGLDQFFDAGYCSCESLLTKKSGRLYQKLLAEKTISAKDTLMIGDSPQGDVLSAANHQIDSLLLFDTAQKYQNKKIEITENLRKQNPFFESATLKEIVDSHLPPTGDYDYDLGIFLAPLYISFVEKVIDYCQRHRLSHLYFLSREGKVFLNIFNTLNHDPSLVPHYLVASRKSVYLTSISKLSLDEINRIWRQYSHQTPSQLLKNLNLPQTLLTVFHRYGIGKNDPLDPNYNFKKLASIIADKQFRQIFRKTQKQQKQYFYDYTSKLTLDQQKQAALIDIGWKGSMQDSLSRLFPNVRFHGLYFGCLCNNNQANCGHKNGLIADANSPDWFQKLIFFNGPLFEMTTTPNEGSCLKYSSAGPITKQYPSEKDNYHRFFHKTQKAIYDYVDIYQKYQNIIGLNPGQSSHFPLDQVIRFIIYPRRHEAASFLRYSHVESFGVYKTSRFNYQPKLNFIFTDLHPCRIFQRFRQDLASQFWPMGIIARANIPLANIIYSLITLK